MPPIYKLGSHKSARALIEAPYHVRFVIQHVRFVMQYVWHAFICLVSSYSSDIDIYSKCSGLEAGKQLNASFCMSAYLLHVYVWSLRVESQIVSPICTSRNETREDSHTRSKLACTNPSRATHSLACSTQVLTSASNKIKQHTHEKATRVVNLDVSCTVYIHTF